MSLELPDLKCPGSALVAVLGDLAQGIRADIENLSEDTPTRIHDIRVSSKKIRSLLKLTHPALPKDRRQHLAGLARQLKDVFSASRDEDVLRQRLGELYAGDDYSAAATALELVPSGETPALPTTQALELADEFIRGLSELDLAKLDLERLGKSAVASYQKARRLGQACAQGMDRTSSSGGVTAVSDGDTAGNDGDTAMHDWRKRVKDVFYQAQVLAFSKPLKKLTGPLDTLADCLGTYHDFALLSVRAAGHENVAERVDTEKYRLARQCFAAADKALNRRPRKLARKVSRSLS